MLKNLLVCYEAASGQSVNENKSMIIFSPNVNEDRHLFLQRILNFKLVNSLGIHLGMPSSFSRKKSWNLKYIKERVWKAIQSWKGRLYSWGGKKVLIKSVVQGIPSYAMACFRLLTSFCKDLMKMMAKFWWHSNPYSRKIHWTSWDKLC